MLLFKSRRERESIIVQSMIRMNCLANHSIEGKLCDDCLKLSEYAKRRLLSCMYGEIKPVCKHCPVHCYSPPMRAKMQEVMQWAGPRMIYKKPGFALMHLVDRITAPKPKAVVKPKRK
jgi:hypothetical protein